MFPIFSSLFPSLTFRLSPFFPLRCNTLREASCLNALIACRSASRNTLILRTHARFRNLHLRVMKICLRSSFRAAGYTGCFHASVSDLLTLIWSTTRIFLSHHRKQSTYRYSRFSTFEMCRVELQGYMQQEKSRLFG